ncbi:hypothetical protein Tcan_01144, partial [Toxocara canis]
MRRWFSAISSTFLLLILESIFPSLVPHPSLPPLHPLPSFLLPRWSAVPFKPCLLVMIGQLHLSLRLLSPSCTASIPTICFFVKWSVVCVIAPFLQCHRFPPTHILFLLLISACVV